MTPVEQQAVEKIESDHRPVRRRVRLLWWRTFCVLDGQPYPCYRRDLASDVRAGRRDVSGRPVGKIPAQRRPSWRDY